MRFGHFDDAAREYVITRPDTPLPWLNYLGCEEYFALITNTAGGYSFYRDARLRRLTRYRYNNIPLDSNGRYIYLRDRDTGRFWSPTWQPIRRRVSKYSCRHGLGYTIISSTSRKIETEIRYFVPLGETLEVWDVTVTNRRDQPAQLDLFSFIEFCLWDAQDDATNFQRNLSTGQVQVDGSTIYHLTEYRERRNHFAYFTCGARIAGFDTARDAFLGPYGGLDAPAVVKAGAATRSIAHGWAPIGSHHVRIKLQPGRSRRIIFLLGYTENPPSHKFLRNGSLNTQHVSHTIQRLLQPEHVDAAFDALRAHWSNLLDNFQCATPNEHVDRMVNTWNQYQCMATFNLSRSASLFESGIGRGLGFRDSNQDLLGFVHMVPERARQRLVDLAATQLPTGGAYHQYQPLTKRGNNDIGGNFNDDPLWLILAVAAYLKETGDRSILNEEVPYDNDPTLVDTMYGHLQHALEHTLNNLGPHGLPLIGRADWNDCLNLNCFSSEPGQSFQTVTNQDGKVAESVLIAGLCVLAAREMEQIARLAGAPADISRHAQVVARIYEAVAQAGWDGRWFLRAYDHFGKPIGSRRCKEGKIFIESNGICAMARIGEGEQWPRKALDAVAQQLATPHGIVLQQPAYSRYLLQMGEITSYPPGYKENAGIFCHTNPWIMIAEALEGRGGRALDYYLRICPSARERISGLHRCEPYVYAQMIAGPDAPTHGEAKNAWLTGTAAWNLAAITQYILGIRAEYDGLRIDPCIPARWKGFIVQRTFRGRHCHITVRNPDGVEHGVTSVRVNGTTLEGTLVSLQYLKQESTIEVVMGRAE
jgi:cellobiose phosphorylase